MPESDSTLKPLLPIRLSVPESAAVEALRRIRGDLLEQACELLRRKGIELSPVDLGSDVAMSLATGYLTLLMKQHKPPCDMERFLDEAAAFSNPNWLSDLILAAGCIQGNDAANLELVRLIEGDVAKSLQAICDPDTAGEVQEDLASHLFLPLKQGFNRGRPRLAQYGGQSSLLTWLKLVAVNRAKDTYDKPRQQAISSEVADKPKHFSEAQELQSEIQASLRTAIGKLVRRLAELKAQQPASVQLDFFVLRIIEGYSPLDVAKRLNVTPSRVTELAGAVFKRLVDALIEEDARWMLLRERVAEAAEHKSRSLRQWLEQWVETFFADDSRARTADFAPGAAR